MGLFRLILALSVVIFHTGDFFGVKLVDGQVAVQAFYLISGFYMAMILNGKYAAGVKGYYLFLSNRLLKIYPIYWAVLLLTFLIALLSLFALPHPGYFSAYNQYGGHLSIGSWLLLGFSNLFIFGQDLLFFTVVDPVSGRLLLSDQLWQHTPHTFEFILVPQAWSISCELMFYLIAPFTARRPLVALYIVAASFLLRYFFFSGGLSADPWSYRFPPFEFQFFHMGILSYFLYRKFGKQLRMDNRTNGLIILSILFLYTIFFTSLPDDLGILPEKFLMFHGGFFVFTFKFWLFIFVLTFGIPYVFACSGSSGWDRKIGELSYPVYICHMLVIIIFELFYVDDRTNSFRTLSVILCTIGFAYLLNRIILEPVEAIRQKRVK